MDGKSIHMGSVSLMGTTTSSKTHIHVHMHNIGHTMPMLQILQKLKNHNRYISKVPRH